MLYSLKLIALKLTKDKQSVWNVICKMSLYRMFTAKTSKAWNLKNPQRNVESVDWCGHIKGVRVQRKDKPVASVANLITLLECAYQKRLQSNHSNLKPMVKSHAFAKCQLKRETHQAVVTMNTCTLLIEQGALSAKTPTVPVQVNAVVTPAVQNTYKPCRSRKCIRGHIPMHAIFAVFYLFFLPDLSRLSFTSRTPDKDQKIEQLF